MSLQLYVWNEFSPDHTDGLAVAIAESETDARTMIVNNEGYDPMSWGPLQVFPLNKTIAFSVSGGA